MAETSEDKKQQEQKPKGSQKKAALIVSLVCVGVVAAIVLMNGGGLSVNSDVSEPLPPEEEPEEEEAPAPNVAPEIVSVVAATDRITPFDLCEVTCEAVDPDGDPLTYTWEPAQGDVYGEGPIIEWGAPDSEGLYRLSVTVEDDRGGSADFSVSLRVKANSIPEILTMSADSDWIIPGESVVVSVTTQDGDSDDLTYTWSSRAGEFMGEGTSVLWIAPIEVDSYWVTLDIEDAYGGKARRAIPMSVTEGQPPVLGAFKLEGIETDMVRPKEGDAWKIFRGRTCSIECVVLEGVGPYEYEWSAEMGTLNPDGPIAIWDAPEGREQVNVVVKVTDSHGNSTSGSVLIYVEMCTCAFK